MKPKTRLDARLIEVFDQLKHIQNDIHQTEQALLHHKNEHNRERHA